MSCAKTAELIETAFGRLTRVGSRNHVLDPLFRARVILRTCSKLYGLNTGLNAILVDNSIYLDHRAGIDRVTTAVPLIKVDSLDKGTRAISPSGTAWALDRRESSNEKSAPAWTYDAGQAASTVILWRSLEETKRYRPNKCITEPATVFKVDGTGCLNKHQPSIPGNFTGTFHVRRVCRMHWP